MFHKLVVKDAEPTQVQVQGWFPSQYRSQETKRVCCVCGWENPITTFVAYKYTMDQVWFSDHMRELLENGIEL